MSSAQPTMIEVDYDPFAQPELQRVAPTTEAQREIWLACQLGTDASLAYNESVSLRIEGALHPDALQRALRTLSNRHEALRATVSDDGMNLLIAADGQLVAEVVNLSANSDSDRQTTMARLRAAAVETPFDLANGPLFRATLAVLDNSSFELILTGHHIICDGWSFGILAPELMKLYAAIAGGKLPALDPAESFVTYALAEVSPDRAAAAEIDNQYWVSLYDTSVPVLELPVDRPRPARRTFASRREDLLLEAPLVAAIRQYGGRQGASLFATMFAMFGGLMARLSGSDEVVIGVPAAGQSATGMDTLVGHCVNLLPIRVATDPNTPLSTLVADARSRVLDAYEHQSSTFGGILRKLQLQRDPSRLPLVGVLFNLDSRISAEALSPLGLRVELNSNPRHFENFELFLNASQLDSGILLELQYNTTLFDQTTVRRWLGLYRAALERAASSPDRSVAEAFVATDNDQACVSTWNATEQPYPRELTVAHLIERQAGNEPERVAVSFGDQRLSYRHLDDRANRLAHVLRDRGVGRGQLVGLCVERGLGMVAAQLAVLKSGAAYVPLDPSYPADRLHYMSEDARLAALVSESTLAGLLSWPREQTILLDADAALIEAQSADRPAPGRLDATPDDPAYVIYTSGSTGKPKGVVVHHRAVVNFLTSMQREPGIGRNDRLVAVTTLSFDIAVLELLLPLTVGAEVVLASRDQALEPQALAELLARSNATIMQATPGTWRMLLDSGWQGSAGFKALIGGEALSPDLAARLLPAVGELWNMYGPTETTVWSTCRRVATTDSYISIGRPIANTTIWILDEHRQPCPIGTPGELWIGGDGVTLGYLNRPELTAERFIPDPFSTRPGARLYCTGDRARLRSDGLLEHLGRNDFQVKVRGFRIELGEIEAALDSHHDIAQTVVIAREDTPGDVRLVAYFVPRGAVPDSEVLRDHLRSLLPVYMLPQHFVAMPQLPFLPNGKINRKALPAPEVERVVGRGRVAPSTPLQGQILEMTERVLNLPGLGIEDDFFTLGGHSLLAARLIAQINREFGVSLPLSTLFQAPTVALLAQTVTQAQGANAPRRQPLIRSPEQHHAPVTIMQERVRFVEDLLPGTVTYSVPSAHRLRGPLDVAKFGQALQMMVDRQSALRTVITAQPGGTVGGYVQSIQDTVAVDLPFVDLGAIPAVQRESALMERMQAIIDTPIALDRAPLMRVVLYRLSDDEHVFLFVTHHLIWDGWSFDLMYNELAELYGALVENRPHKLEPLAITYADFARWHNDWLKGDEFAQQLAFWKSHYRSLPKDVLPRTDRPRAGHMSGTGATLWVRVPKAQTDRLRDLARQYDVTLNMLCMSAFAVVFATALGHKQVALGIPVRGRLESALEPIMGFFTNLMPVHVDVAPDAAFADILGTTKALLIRLFSHADVPFERLVQESEVAEHIRSGGLYQALFSFQDARERRREWGPLRHENVLVKQHAATQDLGLWLMEGPGGMEGGLMYNADLYDEPTVNVLHKAFLTALDLIERDPRQALAKGLVLAEPRLAGWLAPATAGTQSAASDSGTATESRLEQQMAALWARLLGVDAAQIDSSDNFFDLGGSSLLAMRAVAEAGNTLGLKIDPRRFVFESLRQLCAPPAPGPGPAAVPGDTETDTEYMRGFAAIWAKLLGIDAAQVSGEDNFFDLGGSSLLAMRAIAEAERVLGLKIDPARMVYETLLQLSVPQMPATDSTERPADETSDRNGLLSRVFGRFGRRS